jgi:predicted secreted protein
MVLCHCHLNANAVITPLAEYEGVNNTVIAKIIEDGTGLLQLPCPETTWLGMQRWGMTKNQYDTAAYRRFCREILQPSIDQISAWITVGYEIRGVLGVTGSPSCGVRTTCMGYMGGEISCNRKNDSKHPVAKMTPGSGVFIEVLQEVFREQAFDIQFLEIEDLEE